MHGKKKFAELPAKGGEGKRFMGTYFMSATYPGGIRTALQDYAKLNKDGRQKFALVIVGDGAFTESLSPYLTSCVREGLLNDCVHVILSVPPEAPDQIRRNKKRMLER